MTLMHLIQDSFEGNNIGGSLIILLSNIIVNYWVITYFDNEIRNSINNISLP